MRRFVMLVVWVATWGTGAEAVLAQSSKIDLRTREGVSAVKGQWRYHDVKIVEVEGKNKDGSANRTYSYKPKGDTGGPIVAGFNFPNRVELKDAKPGKVYQIAIFAINGPISDTPTNWIFLGPTFLELVDKK